jgi:hypothetical protein
LGYSLGDFYPVDLGDFFSSWIAICTPISSWVRDQLLDPYSKNILIKKDTEAF